MTTCCPFCRATICDFCMHYCFNGEWVLYDCEWCNVYMDDGFCRLTGAPQDPLDECDDFHCFRARTPMDFDGGKVNG